jgi:diacylglycerol O-acyltransferase
VLQRYVGRYAGVPLPHDRPMWEMHVVEGLSEGAAVFSRLHHALADGVSLMQVLLSLTDPDPTGRGEEQQAWGSERHPLVPDGRKVLEHAAVLPRLLTPAGARHGVETAAKLGRAAGKLLLTRNPPTTVRARPGTFKKVVWSPPLPLQAVKDVAQETGTTVNDVLVAMLAGAVHRYLVAAGDRPVDVPTMVPVNIRPLDVPLPRELGNRFALVLLSLPSGLDTPFARLAETQRRMDRIKQSPEAALTFELIRGIGMTGRLLERPLVDFFANKATGVTTNVPGPRETRYLAGARVTGLLGWAPESGDQTLGTSLITYAGTLRVGFKVDAAAIPQPQRLLEAFLAEHEALLGRPAPA